MPTYNVRIDVTLEAADTTDVHGQLGRHFQGLAAGAERESPFAKGSKVTVAEVKTKKRKD